MELDEPLCYAFNSNNWLDIFETMNNSRILCAISRAMILWTSSNLNSSSRLINKAKNKE